MSENPTWPSTYSEAISLAVRVRKDSLSTIWMQASRAMHRTAAEESRMVRILLPALLRPLLPVPLLLLPLFVMVPFDCKYRKFNLFASSKYPRAALEATIRKKRTVLRFAQVLQVEAITARPEAGDAGHRLPSSLQLFSLLKASRNSCVREAHGLLRSSRTSF